VQSIDVITPVLDDPYIFGRVTAVNALSDLYAMGAKPLSALTLLMYNCDIDASTIHTIMQGACDELRDAECVLLGGHTVDDNEVKFGLAVTGIISDGRIYRNSTLQVGDVLIYTKPIGIGILTTALKGELATDEEVSVVSRIMMQSNKKASEIMKEYSVSACTDITGYGLGGHSFEMAKFSGCSIRFFMDEIALLYGALKYAEMGIVPAGAYFNKQFLMNHYKYLHSDKSKEILMFDPQTSGGLLMGVSREQADALVKRLQDAGHNDARIIGEVLEPSESYIYFE